MCQPPLLQLPKGYSSAPVHQSKIYPPFIFPIQEVERSRNRCKCMDMEASSWKQVHGCPRDTPVMGAGRLIWPLLLLEPFILSNHVLSTFAVFCKLLLLYYNSLILWPKSATVYFSNLHFYNHSLASVSVAWYQCYKLLSYVLGLSFQANLLRKVFSKSSYLDHLFIRCWNNHF